MTDTQSNPAASVGKIVKSEEEWRAQLSRAEYKVLRGGSWASDVSVRRSTFRNWDYPIRRQIFAGFRCAADA